jgi:Na+-transporting NADH:ubiquinone oxidoreductase subunit C
MQRDSVTNTFLVATGLCVVCSVLVSSAAVLLRPAQEANKVRERKRNILMAAGIDDTGKPLDELFQQQVLTRVVDLETGEFVSDSVVKPGEYDELAAAKDPLMSEPLPQDNDPAGLRRREKYALVYLVQKDGKLDQLVLPVRGKGLWSTLYGFLALDADMKTIRGITFYEHGETPGLGGEVDNPRWKAQWVGKEAFGEGGQPRIEVVHGAVEPGSPDSIHQVDGLAGATITSRGVTQLVRFWMGEGGFGRFLEKRRSA